MPRENVCSFCGTENETDEYVCRTCQRRLSALPRWARSSRAAGSARRKTWVLRLAAGLALATLVWFNYPYVPNPIIWLKAPSSNLTSVSSPEKWSMRGANPDGSGYIAGTSPALKGEIVHTYDLGVATRSSPAIVEGVVYIGGDFKVTAFDGNNGEPRWETPTAGPVHGTPAVAGQIRWQSMEASSTPLPRAVRYTRSMQNRDGRSGSWMWVHRWSSLPQFTGARLLLDPRQETYSCRMRGLATRDCGSGPEVYWFSIR